MSTAYPPVTSLTGHPGEDLLWDYHRGALAPGIALTVSAHLDLCPHCRADLGVFACVGGAMLDGIEGVEMSANALDLALARIERPEETPDVRTSVRHPAFLDGFDLPPTLKQAAVTGRYWAAPGVWIAPVHVDGAPKGSKIYLMHVKAGMIMPPHSHRGRETTVVLKGRFGDGTGEYGPGDFMAISDDETHSPGVPEGEDCLCLIAQEALIVPHTWLGRLLQPFARI